MSEQEQDAEDFWQDVEHLAYALDGEPAEGRRQRIEHFLTFFPEPDPSGSDEEWRRYAVLHLLRVWANGPLETETKLRFFAPLVVELANNTDAFKDPTEN
jgi:hypothetical protein